MSTPKTPCPKHGGITPAHPVCHGHVSDAQQGFHNLHCRCLGCPLALRGLNRYSEVEHLTPRNWLERLLLKLDPIARWINNYLR